MASILFMTKKGIKYVKKKVELENKKWKERKIGMKNVHKKVFMALIIVCGLGSLIYGATLTSDEVVQSILAIHEIDDEALRLEKYDALAQQLEESLVTKPVQGNLGKWFVEETKDPIDDSQKVFIYLKSSTEDYLIIRYTDAYGVEIFVVWDEYMGFDKGYHSVTMRLDSNTAVTTQWSVSTDKKALFYIGDEQDFLRELMSAKTLVLRSEKYNGSYRTISFDLTGLENAIEPYRSVYGLD